MTETQLKREYGLLIRTKEENRDGDASLTMMLDVVTIEPIRKIRNPSRSNGDPLAEFQVRAYFMQQYPDHGQFEAAFFDSYKVDLRQGERMLKVLKKLHQGLAKLSTQLGDATTFGHQAARLATVLGIEHIIQQTNTPGSSNYDDGRYDFFEIGAGVSAVNHVITQWRKRYPLPAPQLHPAA
jgi:hypothetical protein